MSGSDVYRVRGCVRELLREGAAYRVRLSNGHVLVARGLRRDRNALKNLGIGDWVILEVRPCDLSQGKIVLEEKTTE